MKRIFCDLCGEPALSHLERTFNSPDGRTEDISVTLSCLYRSRSPQLTDYSGYLPRMQQGHICLKCLKGLLEPLPISHAEGVKAVELQCPARINFFYLRKGTVPPHSGVSPCDYKRGHKGAHRASQSGSKSPDHPTEITWDSRGS